MTPVALFVLFSVLNHGIFAALFLWRATGEHAGEASLERSIAVETQTLCAALGCEPDAIIAPLTAALRTLLPAYNITEASWALFMFFYMSVEGVLHLGIVFGGLAQLWSGRASRVFRWSLLLEIVAMDVTYTFMYIALPYGCAASPTTCGFGTTSGDFLDGVSLMTFTMTISWLQHVSVLFDLLTFAVLKCEAPPAVRGQKRD